VSVAIVGLGTWLPEQVRRNDAWPASFAARDHARGERTFNDIPAAEDPAAAAILARDLLREAQDPFLGTTARRVAGDTISAAEAEALAAHAALADAGLSGADVDVLMSNSIVPDRLMPATAGAVADRIGARHALALGIDAACASGVAQLDVARAYIESGLAQVVLLTQSHLLLRAFPLAHPACPGLGDGAAAMVVARGRGRGLALRATFAITHGEHARAVTFVRGHDDATDPPWWKAGGDLRLGSRAPELAKLLMGETVSYGAASVREVVKRAGVDLERVAVLASVQPRGFLPGAIAERLGLQRECAITTYGEIAHVGACGPTFNLQRARNLGLLTSGAIVALYGQGAGFTRAAALVEVLS
jgi:3-oxoacyl-[acyl-carrier-protein] synthase III